MEKDKTPQSPEKLLPAQKGSFLERRIKSFGFAFKGLGLFIRTQPNGWVHLTAAVLVCSLGAWLGLSVGEWLMIILCIGGVLSAEVLNTAVEFLTDLVSPGFHPKAGQVKDLAAAGVLLMAITSVVVGGVIFIPKIIRLIMN